MGLLGMASGLSGNARMLGQGVAVSEAGGKSPLDYARFKHSDHGFMNKKRKLICADCHSLEMKKAATSIRPGAVGHKPCLECHAQQFFQDKPLKICSVCHRTAEYKTKNKADIPFTTTAFRSQFGLAYSHRSHLSADGHVGAVNREYPFALQCEFCHKLAGDGVKRELPSHPQCFVCHAPLMPTATAQLTAAEQAFLPKVVVRMDQCQWCHVGLQMETKVDIFANRPAGNFRHAAHLEEPDPKNPNRRRKVECESCHKNQREVPSVFMIRLPEVKN